MFAHAVKAAAGLRDVSSPACVIELGFRHGRRAPARCCAWRALWVIRREITPIG
jgi:hypothetical protein